MTHLTGTALNAHKSIITAMAEAYDEGYYQARPDGYEEDASSKRAMAAALRVAAEMFPTEKQEHDFILPSSVCACDIERCKQNGSNYEREHMSITNKMTIAPMIRAAICQAFTHIAEQAND